MNSYYEGIMKKLVEEDIEKYFKDFEGEKSELKNIINKFLLNKELKFEEEKNYKENKTHKYRDRIKYEGKEGKCLARVWNCGMGGQCSFTG